MKFMLILTSGCSRDSRQENGGQRRDIWAEDLVNWGQPDLSDCNFPLSGVQVPTTTGGAQAPYSIAASNQNMCTVIACSYRLSTHATRQPLSIFILLF
jgi:hypothetical protein